MNKDKIKYIRLTAEDVEHLKAIAEKYGLSGDSATIRFIINAHREMEKPHAN